MANERGKRSKFTELRSLMRHAAFTNSNLEAVVEGERRLTFAEAWTRGIRFANGLKALGMQPGDRVAVLEDNCVASVDAFVGTIIGNFVRVALYARNAPSSHEYMVKKTGAKVLVVDEKYADVCRDFVSTIPSLETVLVRDSSYEAWLAEQSDEDPDPEILPTDPCIIRFTAGTSGLPKAAMFTYDRWMHAARDWCYTFPPIRPGDACLHASPLSHASGYYFVPMWLSGGRNVLLPRFDADKIIETIEREKVGYMFVVPTMLEDMLAAAKRMRANTQSLRVLEVGGAPIRPETVTEAFETFGPVLHQLYSQTESGPGIKMSPAEWTRTLEGSEPLKSVGRAQPFLQIEVWNDDLERQPPGVIGEVVIRGYGRMECFWDDPEATKERIVDGWVLTGDIGYFDQNGYLYLVDRKNDLIISGGFNIWPSELEAVIKTHPDVIDVSVFGIPDPRWTESPMAVCVVKPDSSLTEQDIIALCAAKLGSYKKPSVVNFVTEPFPRTAVGKVARRSVKALYYKPEGN
jgi:acyl-CoA synthetase (AMP-forming)/AMP-acid ligase II